MSKKKQPSESEYSAENIVKLDPREHVRRRPGMYFGGTDSRALFNLVTEILDFSLESVFVDKCDAIEIRLQPDYTIQISDNDQIIPNLLAENDYDEKRESYSLDAIFQDILGMKKGDKLYLPKFSGGIHGMSISAVNPLASFFDVTVCHQKTVWKRAYRIGEVYGAYQKYEVKTAQLSGVTISFQPDFTIMDKNEFDYEQIAKRCRDITYTLPNLTITLVDERSPQTRSDIFHFPDGIQAFVRGLNQHKVPLHDMMYMRGSVPLKTHRGEEDIHVEVAMQYTQSDDITIQSFVNTMACDGGTHIDGICYALMGYLNGSLNKSLDWEQVAKGLTVVVNLVYPHDHIWYESQLVRKVMNAEAFDAVVSVVYPQLMQSDLRKTHQKWSLS